MPLVTEPKKVWKLPLGKNEDERCHGIKREKGSREAQKKVVIGEEQEEEENMRGGSLTRFRTDKWYDQDGKGLLVDIVRGGLQGLKRTRNPFKLPSNILSGFETGLTRCVKRKAEDVIKREITKRAKKALGNKDVKKAVRVASALFPKQVKRARDIFGV